MRTYVAFYQNTETQYKLKRFKNLDETRPSVPRVVCIKKNTDGKAVQRADCRPPHPSVMPTAAERVSQVSVHDMASNEDAMLGQLEMSKIANFLHKRKMKR